MKYIYHVTKIWYEECETIESNVPLTDREIRNRIDGQRVYCDEYSVDEEVVEDTTEE